MALQEERAAAFLARDEALKIKGSLIGELEGERKAVSEARATIGRLNQAEIDARGEFEKNLTAMQEKLELEKSTAAEAKRAVEAIRSDVRQELQEKQTALDDAERASETLRSRLAKLEADSKQKESVFGQRLEDERKAKEALESELRRDRAELSKAKDAVDEARADFNRQLKANQVALTTAESEIKRQAETSRVEIEKLRATGNTAHAQATKAEIDEVRLAMQQTIDEERRAKAKVEADRSRLLATERDAKAEIDRLRSRISAMSISGQGQSEDADRLRRELDVARRRQRELEIELDRLRGQQSQQQVAPTKKVVEEFTTDAPRPASLYDRRPDIVDDLKEVKGIGPVMERILNDNGCYHFKQLANFSRRDMEWISQALGSFPDQIERDNWIGQAQALYAKKYGQRHDLGAVRTLKQVS